MAFTLPPESSDSLSLSRPPKTHMSLECTNRNDLLVNTPFSSFLLQPPNPLSDFVPISQFNFQLHSSHATLGVPASSKFHQSQNKKMREEVGDVPRLTESKSGRSLEIEKFSQYVARQLGFEGMHECLHICQLANDHLKQTKGHEESIFAFFANEPNAENLTIKFIEEIDKCIMGYFAYHWNHATSMITQILSHDDSKLRNMVMEATRKLRFERVLRELKVTRIFSTILDELRAIGVTKNESKCTNVMIPAARSDRSAVLLLMGGGMGAGKSTVLKEILKDAFWSEAGANAVVVEADAFKETDVFYKAISSRGHHNDMLQTAELVHQSSTNAASSLLVTALNEGRDVIMDGTLSWEPFVQQTIEMARNIHKQRYRMGVGYKIEDDGSISENYWEPVEEEEDDEEKNSPRLRARKPYRIEIVGVVSDAYLAVVRGIRRAITTRRAVRVRAQLRSHKSFANAFPRYCQLVDGAKLYSSNSKGSAKLIGVKCASSELLVDPNEIGCLEKVCTLNEDAKSIHELYPDGSTQCGSTSVWKDLVMCPSRALVQQELKAAIKNIESRSSSQ
ncbi:P-loop containing nucleoside triphosphate hydrolases superfamily protein [Rhynchospora pubera]|uniref:P-loop containing nucleoside triphosphate hydrolases superfamily protein n=1 Tax=Rhynchospora pubera TaxID=906938 RepID=A0AAV8CFP8_9POAL|nr:P-loop containing nucleoside triphosphate hydrolases superfamily protein [Rhynchospora pubera]